MNDRRPRITDPRERVNHAVQHAFLTGHAVDVLVGDGEFFIPDVTYRDEHDQVLVISQLLLWARLGHPSEAMDAFVSAILQLLRENRLIPALGLLLSYLIVSKEYGTLSGLTMGVLIEAIGEAVDRNTNVLSEDARVRELLIVVSDRIPELKSILGLR